MYLRNYYIRTAIKEKNPAIMTTSKTSVTKLKPNP
jgi:hypothetical protein